MKLRRPSCLRIIAYSWLGVFLVLVCLLARPTWHLFRTCQSDVLTTEPAPLNTVNDASHLNRTSVTQTIKVKTEPEVAENQLRELLALARRKNLKVSIAGARHTMGGHTIYPGGIALDMLPYNHLSYDDNSKILTAGAGARWEQIIPFLHERGRAVSVMQSNNNFSVGGSLSANCHGWQTGQPPIASTVRCFRLMKADGTIVKCSRLENRELFSLVLGGYGLFGIILDAELDTVPNEALMLERREVSVVDYAHTLESATTTGSDVVMVYGRMNVTPSGFLKDARLNLWKHDAKAEITTGPMMPGHTPYILRAVFRGSVGNDYGKKLRWFAESELEPRFGKSTALRSALQNYSAEWFENHSTSTTDILHEYFIPPDRFVDFSKKCAAIIPRHHADLLNVTVRDVQPDDDTFLRYADKPMLGLVMLFNQPTTSAGEAAMEALTQELIDAALDCDGRFYLPYRLHATPEQIRRAYPMLDSFLEKKQLYDPDEIFQNEFYRKYATAD